MSNPGQPGTGELPAADELFSDTPGADELFPDEHHASFTGQFSDAMFQNIKPLASTLNGFAEGAKNGWGSEDEKKQLSQISDTDYLNSKNAFLKGINDHFIRPLAYGATLIGQAPGRALGAALGGIQGGIEGAGEGLHGAGEDITNSKVAGGSLIGGALETAGQFPAIVAAGGGLEHLSIAEQATLGRAKGVIGEGEKGFFNTEPVTPENIQARNEAAQEAGVTVPETIPPPTFDLNELAREVAPDTFKQYDQLQDLQGNLRASLQYLSGKRGEDFQRNIDTILARTGGDESQLGTSETSRLANARAQLAESQKGDTPEMTAARQRLLEADIKVRDLLPDINEAKGTVQSLLDSDSKEGAAYRDLVQSKMLEKSEALQDEMVEAYTHADSLLPDQTATSASRNATRAPGKAKEGAPAPDEGTGSLGPENPISEAPRASGGKGEESANTLNKGQSSNPDSVASQEGPGYPEGSSGQLKLTQGTGDRKTAGSAQAISDEAVARGVSDQFSGLPEYNVVKDAPQFPIIAKLISEEPQKAFDIAMGREAAPEGVYPLYVMAALKSEAYKVGDVELVRQLAQSDLHLETSEHARQLRAAQALNEDDPVSIIRSIEEVRKEAAKTDPRLAGLNKELLAASQDFELGKTDLISFINEIMCK